MPSYFEDDIVIAGISGRLPESSNIEEFKENLMKGTDMVTEDERRWKPDLYGLPSRIGKLKNLHSFDASFFKIPPKQAHIMDPQLRIMLEVTYEALIDAGVNPFILKKSHTGVFIGVYSSDANDFGKRMPDGHEWVRSRQGIIATRISYFFDLIGPSYSVDTLCSSSLTAMHQAIVAIRTGECDAAIVGGLNLVLDPIYNLHHHRMNLLSTDGKCKSFDVSADGYVRSEAVVAIYLQKMTDARRVYATVMNTAINTDGYKPEGIMHPSGDMQYLMLQKMYNAVNIDPKNIVYVEAHGTGTRVGDPEELGAIDKLFCKDRKTPLLIGSVKSNMGHAEAASGLSGIAKVLIAMETGVIPANLHFAIPNPKIDALTEGRIRVIDKNTPWNGGLVGINSFGAGGTNSHVILRSNSKVKTSLDTVEPRLPKLVVVSGRTKEAVQILLNKANEHRQDNEFLSLLYSVHSDNLSNHNIRGYEILAYDSTREIVEANYDERRPIWFIFSGIGTQWPGMGRELLKIETCQRSLQRCADVLKQHDVDLMNIIINGTDETYKNVLVATVSIVAIQIALIDMLICMGVQPDGIIGHSLGEISCSYADGAFTLEQTILAAYYRGKSIIESDLEPGAMAVVNLNWEEIKNMCLTDIVPACHNSADLVTISGSPVSVEKFVEELKSKNIFAKMINCCGVAYHSKYIVPVKSKFCTSLDMIVPKPKQRSVKWISSSVPEAAWDSTLAQFCSPEYHVNNMLSPVLFQEAIAHIPKNAITIEIAPHCLLQTILRKSLPSTVTNIGLQKLNHSNNLVFLLSNVGKMYTAGAQPDIFKLYPPVSFPVSRGTPMIGSLIKWDHSVTWQVPDFKPKESSGEHVIEINLSRKIDEYLMGHKIDGRFIFPGAGFITMVWQVFAKLHDTTFERLSVIFENVWFQRITFLSENKTIKFFIKLFEGKGDFEILEANTIVASGNIRAADTIEENQLNFSSLPISPTELLLNNEDIYKKLRLRGYEYNGLFKGIKSCDNSFTIGELHWFNEWSVYLDSMFQFGLLSKGWRLIYASKCRYVMINPVLHKQLLNELSKDSGLPIFNYRNVNIIRSGGIEFRDVKYTTSQRQQKTARPKHERYVFVPYENSYNLVSKDPKREKIHALTVLLQIVCENVTISRIKAVEVADNRAAESLLAPLVLDILCGEPVVTIDLEVAVHSTYDYATDFDKMNINFNVIKWDANDTFPAQNMHLVIAAEVLSGQSCIVLKNLAATISSNCFILLEETDTFSSTDLKIALKEANLMLIGKQIDFSGKSYFLLRKRKMGKEPILIQITGNDFSWLANAKAALRKFDNKNQDIYFVSQGEELLGLVGFITCMRREIANVHYVFIQDNNAPKFDLFSQFYVEQLEKGLMANVLKGGQWGSYRHLQLDQHKYVELEHVYVDTLTTRNLNSLEWIQSPLTYYQTKYPNTFCSVYYASLNFRDILLAIGKLSMDALSSLGLATEDYVLGFEFSGRDANGCRVMGLTKSSGLATTVLPDSDFLWKVPDTWTLEQAATIPVAYATSYYALFVRGRLIAGESVLIHSGAGAVGLAAINIALHAGCTVFATVGTKEKRLYLKKTFSQLTDKHIGNSRDTSFEQLILDETQGRGVDVVLNSLSEEKLHASVRCLAENGRFLDIGKYDMLNGNRIDMSIFLKNTSYHGILLEMLFKDSQYKRETITLMSEGIENGVVRPLPTTVFSQQSLEQGFRFMTTGKHIGKILLKIRDEEPQKCMLPMRRTIAAISRTYMYPDKSYVLIGGLGGFGLELANWMISRGAKFIVLVSRTGIRTGYQMLRVQQWRNNGIKVIISTADTTTLSGVECLIDESNRLAPVGGIFNLAVVLRDALFENLHVDDFESVISPKINCTRNLDVVSRKSCPSLDHFVVFSSVSCGRGNVCQSNYGLANSAIERMIEQRHTAGLPGLAIQWGSIGDVGLYVDAVKNEKNFDIKYILPQRMSSCLETIDVFLQQPYPVLSSMVIDEKHNSTNNDDKIDHVAQIVGKILGIENISVYINESFDKLGIDSLTYMEIRQILEREYDFMLSFREMYVLTLGELLNLLGTSNVSHDSSTS